MKTSDSTEQKLRDLGILIRSRKVPLNPMIYYDVRGLIKVMESSIYVCSGDKRVGYVEGNSAHIGEHDGEVITFTTEVQDWGDELRFLPHPQYR